MVAFSKHSAGLSFQFAIALTPLADMLVIVGEFLSWSVCTILSMVCGRWLRSGVAMHSTAETLNVKGHVAILVAWPCLRGPICEIKLPVQELRLKM